MDHIDLNKYLTIEERRPGRPRYDQKTLLKIILFAFMENGYASVREIEKYCKTDTRYMWLLQDNPPPSHMTIDNFMKFTMYEKESKNEKYRNDPYRAVNFPVNERGLPVCPNGKEFHFIYSRPVRGNKYGRTEEYFQCEDCSGCPHKEKCCKCKGNRIVRLNEELTQFHAEVLNNLNSIHGALLRMNRSIQSEGTFGTIKWNRSYIRARRRGIKSLFLEFGMISCGFNLHKLHLKRTAFRSAA